MVLSTSGCSKKITEPEIIENEDSHAKMSIKKEKSKDVPEMNTTPSSCGFKDYTSSSPAQKSQHPAEDSGLHFEAVFHMPYNHFCIKIFKVAGEPPCFLYEPIVLCDPQAMKSQLDRVSGKAYVRITIEMWNAELTEEVVSWLKRQLCSQDVQHFRVHAMPFEEVQLVSRGKDVSTLIYRLPEHSTPYNQLDQRLHFHLMCETKEAADIVAESFLSDPDFAMRQLRLECTSLGNPAVNQSQPKRARLEAGASSSEIRPSMDFKINTTSRAATPTEDPPIPGWSLFTFLRIDFI